MDESKNFAAHTAYTSHPVQTSSGALAETRGPSHTLRSLPVDKPTHSAISSGGIPASLPLVHAPATATSTSVQYQMPANEVRPAMVSRGGPSSHLGRDSSSLSLPKVERAQFKLDGGSNGSTYASQLQGIISSYENDGDSSDLRNNLKIYESLSFVNLYKTEKKKKKKKYQPEGLPVGFLHK